MLNSARFCSLNKYLNVWAGHLVVNYTVLFTLEILKQKPLMSSSMQGNRYTKPLKKSEHQN